MSAYLPTLRGFAKFTLGLSGALVVLAAGALYFGQTYLIYPAYVPPGSREIVATPADYGMPYDDVELVTADGVKIKAYVMIQRTQHVGEHSVDEHGELEHQTPLSLEEETEYAKSRPTVLFFHANAGNMGHRLPLARMFYLRNRCNVLILSYRGYGKSEGSPSQKGIQMDSQAALDYALDHPILGQTNLIFYGQSLGGAVAIDLASRNPEMVKALILENTFTSIPAMARKVIPMATPFLFLCTEIWNSLEAVKKIRPYTHVLLLSGLRDELVPPGQMKQLWAALRNTGNASDEKGGNDEKIVRRRRWEEFPNGTHNDTCVQPEYWNKVEEFILSMSS